MGGFNPLAAQMDNPATQDVPGAAPPDPTQQLEQQSQSNIAGAHPQQPQQQAPPNPADAPPPQPPSPPRPQGGLIKQLLSNFFAGAGDAMMHHVGLPTPEEQAQQEYHNKLLAYNAQQIAGLRQAQAAFQTAKAGQTENVPKFTEDLVQQYGLPASLVGMPITAALGGLARGQMSADSAANVAQIGANSRENVAANRTASPFSKVDPIIGAQLGAPPDATKFSGGADDPAFRAKSKEWGIQAETIKNRMSAASGAARGAAFNMTRAGAYVTPDGQLVTATAGEAIKNGYTQASPSFNVMSKQAQFGEMKSASTNLRSAINNLDTDFSVPQKAKLQLAMRAPDESTSAALFDSLLGAEQLTDKQQDYVIWQKQMAERVLSLRNVAGMGQASDQTRRALVATIPTINNKGYALKQLDAVDNQINQLYRGIANRGNAPRGANTLIPTHRFNPVTGRIEAVNGG